MIAPGCACESVPEKPAGSPKIKSGRIQAHNQAARRKLEVPMPAAMLCKIPMKSS